MQITYDQFLERLTILRGKIAETCAEIDRDPATVSILPVTKRQPDDAVLFSAKAGLPSIGENRVQEARDKRDRLADCRVRWELIGSLQTNKAKVAVDLFDRIQSVDRAKLARALNRHAGFAGCKLAVLLQVNAGADPAKHGCRLEEAPRVVEAILECAHLQLDGLMTIAPLSDDPDVARRTFDNLRECRDKMQQSFSVPLPELSMGMTSDLREAIKAGSTQVRVGTALFGPRD